MAADPAVEWMLPDQVRPRTGGNAVRPLVHGADYFRRLGQVVSATDTGDRIFFTDWRGDADQRLDADGPTVSDLFATAAARGVQVRALLWRSHSDKTSFSAQENQELGRALNAAGAEALLDQRVRRGGSHHQKLVIVRHRNRPEDDVAFVGGIDLCHGRRDDARHCGDPQQQPMDPRYGERAPWHDAMVEIRGPAVCDVLATFTERWTDPTPLDHRNPYRALLHRLARMPRRADPLPPPFASPPPAGHHAVQVLRTYSAKWPAYPFAPGGERTVAQAYARAFARARSFVYVEDQYLWSGLVARTLADALRDNPHLQAIAVVPRYPDQDGRFSGPPNRLGQVQAMELLHAAGGDRVQVFDLVNAAGTPIYVHAKICVVDDVWMTCGSDNFNRRSWTHDSEITCAVVDGETDPREPADPSGSGLGARRLPRELRVALWAEHLGLAPTDPRLVDAVTATRLWRERATALDDWYAGGQVGARPPGQARVHRPDPVSRLQRVWATPLYRLVYDPDGRPLSVRFHPQRERRIVRTKESER
ncbi:MAG TPA: phospholipase D-like domain-containing protein [Mycobacteriales bacterium]|nr:phospholipase D-like domain-containing protein [Mycobacteriales bacterium]